MREEGEGRGPDVGIRVSGAILFDIILDLSLQFTANSHGIMSVRGIVKSENSIEHNRLYRKTVVLEQLEAETDTDRLLFQGVLRSVMVDRCSEYLEVTIEAVTGTWYMDIERKSRSFQDTDMTYADVIKTIAADMDGAAVICTEGKQKIGKPIIQYQETDWEFTKRLAGLAGAAVIPERRSGLPKFWFGMRKGRKRMEVSTNSCQTIIHDRYKEKCSRNKDSRNKELSYILQGPAGIEIGDQLMIDKQEYIIYRIEGKLISGELIFYYWIGSTQMGTQQIFYQSYVSGISLKGKTEILDGEKIGMKLDIDGEDAVGSHLYDYQSLTGNVMYCMPEKNTTVSLHYINEDEREAVIIDNPGWDNDNITTCSNELKRLETDYGKELILFPSTMGISGRDQNGQSSRAILTDGDGIMFDSNKNMTIAAHGAVILKAPAIHIDVPLSIEINQSN